MNDCVKTGFIFLDLATGEIRTGDLFFIADLFQIRGVNKTKLESGHPVHAAVVNVVYANRADSEYQDTNMGVKLLAPSEEFIKHIEEWYPYLKDKISPVTQV